jgi:quercetin dioxygenase-like cupin family protein
MWIKKTKANFKDKRGEIRDILVGVPSDAITFITCAKGSVRGNHYHKKTDQYDYVLSGSFTCATKDMLNKNARMKKKIIKTGDLVFHPQNEAHAFKAKEKSSFLSITKGPRQGKHFEKDTIRLEKPLVK